MTVQTDHTSRPARILARYVFPAYVIAAAVVMAIHLAEWVPPSSLRLTGGHLNLNGYAVVIVLLLALMGIGRMLSPVWDWLSDRFYIDWLKFRVRRHHLHPGMSAQHPILREVHILEVINTAELDEPWMVVQPQLEGTKAVLVPADTLERTP